MSSGLPLVVIHCSCSFVLALLGLAGLVACSDSSPPAPKERVIEGWGLRLGDGVTIGCCSSEATDPGGAGLSLRLAYWRDATKESPSPWYEPGPLPSCLREDKVNKVRLRVLDVPGRLERPATSIVTELECLD